MAKRKWTKIDCFKVGEKLAIFHLANSNNKLYLKNQFGINFWNKTFINCRKRLNELIPNCVEIIEKEFFFYCSDYSSFLSFFLSLDLPLHRHKDLKQKQKEEIPSSFLTPLFFFSFVVG